MSSLSGYETEFVDPPKELQYSCSICLCILRDPQLVNCCGNSFCLKCLLPIVKDRSLQCPLCKGNPKPLTSDKRLHRDLSQKDVYCQFREKCSWIGRLADFDEHMNFDPESAKRFVGCPHAVIKCEYCKKSFARKDLQDHENTCPKRPYPCQYCKEFTAVKSELERHYGTCIMYPVECTNDCSAVVQRFKLQSHLATECPLTAVNCDFHFCGCEAWLMRRDMEAHLMKHSKEHADEALRENCLLFSDLVTYKDSVRDNISLLEENKTLKSENLRFECELENLVKELEELSQADVTHRRNKQEIERLRVELKQKDSIMKVHVAAGTSFKATISKLEKQLDDALLEATKQESLVMELQKRNGELLLELQEKDEEVEELYVSFENRKSENDAMEDELTHLKIELDKRDRIIAEQEKKLKSSSPRKPLSRPLSSAEGGGAWPDYTEFSPYDDGSQEDPIPFSTIFYKEPDVHASDKHPALNEAGTEYEYQVPLKKGTSGGSKMTWSHVVSKRKPQATPTSHTSPTKPHSSPFKVVLPRSPPKIPCKLMIRNTPSRQRGITDADIVNLFSKFGRVYSINRNGSNTAVVYDNVDSVQSGVVASERRELECGGIILNCTYEKKTPR